MCGPNEPEPKPEQSEHDLLDMAKYDCKVKHAKSSWMYPYTEP